jgi:RNA polymerase sigma-70 factor (ECF subfamily)
VAVLSEREAAAELCRRLQPGVFSALALYCGDTDLAEDLTQETLLRVWKHWQSVSEMERPDRWALRVAFNLAKSRWRRRRIERAIDGARTVEEPRRADPTDVIVVRVAVAMLPPRQRAAVVVRYFNDLSVTDAAMVLGCAEGTVKALTHQAVANLRVILEDDLETLAEDGHG